MDVSHHDKRAKIQALAEDVAERHKELLARLAQRRSTFRTS